MNEPAANDELPSLMDRYVVTIVIPLEYEVRGATIALAADEAKKILTVIRDKHPAAKLHRIMNDVTYVALEAVVDPVATPEAPKPAPPRGSPPSGGTPGTPVVRVEENLNVVAKVA